MKHYTREKNAQIIIALLKAHGIRTVVASPGATNVSFVGSIQGDSWFQIYSSVDERSAAYMACGLAAETGEPVVISCTGATAARNYFPGLTEAFYRKLPVLAITSSQPLCRVGHNIPQVTDRSQKPKDAVKLSLALPIVKDDDDFWECEIKVNQAILELFRKGGGPVHLNLPTQYSQSFDVEKLPACRVLRRFTNATEGPDIPRGRVGVFVGSHGRWTKETTEALDAFCLAHDGVVMCDHTSGYKGEFGILTCLIGGQRGLDHSKFSPDLLIHLGEVTGDYYGLHSTAKEVWRVSLDGEIRDPLRKLTNVFEMSELDFFSAYAARGAATAQDYLKACRSHLEHLRSQIPDIPFSNIWLASRLAHRIPKGSAIHFGILNSLRAWNFFELPDSVDSSSNVGGFGIDGAMSTLIGASLANPAKLYFGVLGDLAFFYDMNSLGNRHVGNNLRILLVNNGKGTEFRQYGHHAAHFGDEADTFIAAAGHFGRKSPDIVRHYAGDLGFEYLCASTKEEVDNMAEGFLTPEIAPKPMLLEVFTDSADESKALELVLTIEKRPGASAKEMAKNLLGEKSVRAIKSLLGRGKL